ncbi:1-aminocyclopropane-1-carboxylate oxidase 1 [Cannabis sativa]|uniref:1-aminocyclopropane-1-carboxylate oxidase 1 n=1 Tax=Cannabis sativa TaxID=3483 RepID=UPI0029CA03C1|nr:1-aminocyclopropane-1-carboxylate oxidase 1 [Cannabis sativa]
MQIKRERKEMEIPVIDFDELDGKKRSNTMAQLHEACEKWGCFQIKNHGIDEKLMEKVKHLVNTHYEENLKQEFYESQVAKRLEIKGHTSDVDWESSFFIWHRPVSNMEQIENLPKDFCSTMNEYIVHMIKLAEKLSGLMCENLGLERDHIKDAFSGTKGPSVGTKVAKYPKCPNPELVKGLREHTDAGGIILLLQDDQVPGLQFLKDGEWIAVPPSKNNTIFVNTGDQVEILSNGRYKSALHRVMAEKNGSRLSIATFYNPAGDAIISPAPKLLYPNHFRFQDYLKLYVTTKFSDKGPRFESMKQMANGNGSLLP